jgi:hypothetical protein
MVKTLLDFAKAGKLKAALSWTALQRGNKLLNTVTCYPKSRNWEKRAKAGTNKPWFNEVDDVVR